MKPENIKRAAPLIKAYEELERIGRHLTDKPVAGHDAIHLELSAAEMRDGFGQSSRHYCYVSAVVGRRIVLAARKILAEELKRLGATQSR